MAEFLFFIFYLYVANRSMFRIVMDGAAAYHVVSLNSVLLQGPYNFNSFLCLLFRFRFYLVAVVVNIKSMFYPVKCRPKDRSALQFLF